MYPDLCGNCYFLAPLDIILLLIVLKKEADDEPLATTSSTLSMKPNTATVEREI